MAPTHHSQPPPPGVYVPAVLFFTENEDLDLIAIKSHILRLAEGGVTGILVQGSNGEAQHLSHDERKQAIQFTRQTLDQNGFEHVLVIAGTGALSTRETKKLCIDAKDAGASHVLVLTPSLWPPQMTKENITNFFHEVADASPLPVMIYNFPTVTAGIDLDSDILIDLASHPNIVGTKLSCGNIGKLNRITQEYSSSRFAVYAGKSDCFVLGLLANSAGTIAALPNIVPKVHRHAYDLFKAGKIDEALKLQGLLGKADWATSKIGGIAGVKAIVSEHFGYGQPIVRGPLRTLNYQTLAKGKYTDVIEEALRLERSLPNLQ
jgi:4-hydroxy-2-oxoglutarate aldolase